MVRRVRRKAPARCGLGEKSEMISSETYLSAFPYTTDGHYVVIKGVSGNSGLVNDPHPDYSNAYTVPFSSLLNYSKAHAGGGYLICVN